MIFKIAFGEVIVSLIAWAIRDWKKFQIVVSVPLFLQLLLFFIIPESPRWLIATGKYQKAKQILEKAAAKNKVHVCIGTFKSNLAKQ